MKKVFTTGQVAKICKVAPRTVSKWFDSGRLKGYRIPGSQDRRIPREQLIKFLKEHGMPLGELEEEEWHKVLVIGAEKLFIDRLKEILPEDEDYKYEIANSGFEAGIQAESFHPDTIIIDLALGRTEAIQITANLRRRPFLGLTALAPFTSVAYSAEPKTGRERRADVVVVGGGTGGVAAALAAARAGLRVILTEETDWVGGQLTSQAVPPDEHPWIES